MLKCFATFAETDFSHLRLYIILIHHPALARGLRVLQNKNKSPKSLSASRSCAPYNKFLTSPKVASNNFNKSLAMYLLYLKYVKVRRCYSDWPWPVAVPSVAVVGLLGVIYSSCDQEGHSLAVQDQAVLLLVPGNGRCLPSHADVQCPGEGRHLACRVPHSPARAHC